VKNLSQCTSKENNNPHHGANKMKENNPEDNGAQFSKI